MNRSLFCPLLAKFFYSAFIIFTNSILSAQVPTISSFTPASGPIGTTVTITGTNFDTTPANNIVWFGAVQANVTAASATELTVTAPAGTTYKPISVTVSGNTAYSSAPFIVTFPSTRVIDEEAFASYEAWPTTNNPWDLTIGDLDIDGKPDLIVINSGGDVFTVFRNTSTTGYIIHGSLEGVTFPTGSYPICADIGDLDGDGKPDLVVANNSDGTISIYRNTSTSGSIAFDTKVDFTIGSNPYDVVIGDIDSDGKPDLAVTNNGSNIVSILRNTSTPGSITSGSFAAQIDFATVTNPSRAAISDIDGDGKPDLIVNNLDDNTVSVFRNTSTPGSITSGSLTSGIDFVTGSRPYGIAVGDLDGDGKQDVVVTNNGSSTFSVFRNTSTPGSITSGSLASKVDFPTGDEPYGLSIGEIDGDGRPDLAIAGYASYFSVYRNTSISGSITSNSFSPKFYFGIIPGPADVVIGDLDGDGKPDLLGVTNYWPYLAVLQNIISEPVLPVITSFAPASGPVGTEVTITGTNFNTTASDNIVWFGAVKAEVTAASSTELTVTVPVGATYQPISVTVKGYTAWSNAPFNVTFPVIRPVDASAFAPSTDFSTGVYPWNVAVGDIDGDGKPDLAVTNVTSNSVSVYRNISSSGSVHSSSFSEKVDFATGGGPYGVVMQDIDGDGKLDLAVVNSSNVSIFRNTSIPGSITASSFADRVDFPAGSGSMNVAFSDIDGDGKPDMVFQDSHSNLFSVYRNISTPGSIVEGSFEARVDFITGTGLYDIAVADIDGDGKPDVAATNNTSNTVSVFRNTSISGTINPASFAGEVNFTTGLVPRDIFFGDIDGDGKPDMIVVNNSGQSISVFRNTSTSGSINSGSFDGKIDFTARTSSNCATIGDINGDGKQDLIVTNYGSSTVSVLKNISTSGSITTGSLASKIDLATGAGPIGVAVADIDGDGRPDLIVVNANANSVSVIRNRISDPYPPVITSFTPTSGPVGTAVTITGTHFDITPANNIVWFGAVQAAVTGASETELTVTVPAGATYQPITVTVNGLTVYSDSPFNITFPSTHIIDAESFSAKIDFATGTSPTGAAVGDIDGDGKPDLIAVNYASSTISVYRNTSTSGSITAGSLAAGVDFTTGNNPYCIDIGDIDGDGKLDLVVTNNTGSSISVFRNTSTPGSITSGSFSSRVDFITGLHPYDVAIDDIDGDGKPDLAVTNNVSNTVSVFRNTSTPGSITSASFETKVDFSTGINPSYLAIGDIDGDGKPDLAVNNYNGNSVSIFRNTSISGSISTGSFAAKVDFSTGTNPYGVVIGDIDRDGKPDLTITNNNSNTISVFRNTSISGSITSGSFDTRIDLTTGSGPLGVAIADLDGDGKPDLAVANSASNTVSVIRNISMSGSFTTSSFTAKVDFSTGAGPANVVVDDIDGDGKPELVVANTASNTVSVLQNTISEPAPPVITSFTPASGPVGTTVTITGINFNITPAKNVVWFGAVMATITAASATELTVTVPAGASYHPISVTVKGYTGWSTDPFVVTFPATRPLDASAFAGKVDFTTGTYPFSVAINDLDGDGKPDLVVANDNSNTVSVYRNTSSSGSITADSFTDKVDFTTGTSPRTIAIGDIDGDGKPDIAVTNIASNTVSVFRNTSTSGSITAGSFAARVDFTMAPDPFAVVISDIDGDGKPELIVNSDGSNTVSVLRNTSTPGYITTGSFDTKVDFTTGMIPSIIAISDIDGDGKPDLVVVNETSNTVSVFRNTSISGSITTGSFAARVDFSTGSYPICVAISDIDGDGKPDLVVTNNSSNTVSIFKNTSISGSITSGSFAAKVDFTTGMGPTNIVIGDIDGDNKPDLAVSNYASNTVSVLINISTSGSITEGSFAAKVDFATGTNPYNIAIGDIDCDGKPDLAISNVGSNTVSILRNKISDPYPPVITSFTPTSGPIGTTVTITGTHFDTTPANNNVWFGAVKAIVTDASATELDVTVPTGATYKPISVTVTGNTAFSSKPFNVTFPSTYIIDIEAFPTKVDFPTGANPQGTIFGDIDGDGKPDLIVTNTNNNTVSIYRNISTTGSISADSFASKVDFTTGPNPFCVAYSDIDGDGKPDLIVTNSNSSGSISVLRNTSTVGTITAGSFAEKIDFTSGSGTIGIAVGDIDGDGKPDIAVANMLSNTISVFWNTSYPGSITAGSLAPRIDFATGSGPVGIAIGDIDGDNKPDIVVPNFYSQTVSIYRNISVPESITTSSFAPKVDLAAGSISPFVIIADIDGDSKPDLILTNQGSNTVSVFRNVSASGSITTSSFAEKVDFTTGSGPTFLTVGNINGDSKPDLVVANYYGNSISVLRNTSISGSLTTGSFDVNVDFTTGSNPYGIAVCDIDGDGKPDLAVVNAASNTVSVLQNTISDPIPPVIASFTPTSGPVGTVVTITGTNFSTAPAKNIVWFGAVQATVTAASATELTVTVPAGATYQPITVTVKGMTAYSSTPFIVTLTNPKNIDSESFNAKVDFPAGANPENIAIGDIDGDGKSDLIITDINNGIVSVYRNTSIRGFVTTGSFSAKVDFVTGSMPKSVCIGDIDGDGKPDIVVANSDDNTVSVFRNLSTPGSVNSGSFNTRVDFNTGTNPSDVAIGDIDGDGKSDIIVTNYSSNSVSILRNISSPGYITADSFVPKVDFTTGSAPQCVITGDIDGDTKPDLAITRSSDSSISLFRNISIPGSITSGSFDARVDLTAGMNPTSIAFGDIDLDGKPEISVVNSGANTVSVFINNSTPGSITPGSLTPHIEFAAGVMPKSIAIGDINGDIKPDLAIVNNSGNSVSVLMNTSTPGSITTSSFASKVDFSTGTGPLDIVIGDIDGDGKSDLSVIDNGGSSVSVIRNRISEPYPPVITSFTPASGPVGITLTITGTNFDTTPANNFVWFGAVKATVTTASATELTVTVPTGATYKPISVTVNGLTAYSAKPFNIIFSSTRIIDATILESKVDFPTATEPWAVTTGDIDGDGKQDLIISNQGSNTISIFRNTSTSGSIFGSSLESKVDLTAGMYPKGIAVGDIDGNGKPDIIVANYASNSVSVFRNTSTPGSIGAGSFAARVDFPTGTNPYSVAIGDIDGDGRPDISVTNDVSNSVSVLINNCISGSVDAGSFAAKVDFTTGTNPRVVVIGDIDMDGKPDLITGSYNDHTFSVFRNTSTPGSFGSGSFAAKVDFSSATSSYAAAFGDIDGDDKPDLIFSSINDNTISIYRNTSIPGSITAGSFADRTDFTTGAYPSHISIGDLDGDDKPDIVVTNLYSNTLSLYRNTSTSGTITTSSLAGKADFYTWTYPSSAAIGDIDGDGKPDIIVVNTNSNAVSVYRNRIPEPAPPVIASFTPASGPIGTTVTITGSNFSTTPANNIVWFGAVQATVTSATSTQLGVSVPTGATYQPITVTVNGLTAYSGAPFNVTFLSTLTFDATSFDTSVNFTTETNPVSAAASDFDGDGKTDLAVVNSGNDFISVFRNISSPESITSGSFNSKVDFYSGSNPHGIAVGDIDGDGKPDIVVANYGNNSVSVFRNTGISGSITSGSFAARVDFTTGANPYDVAIGDIDGDGKPDLAVTNYTDNTVSVLRNKSISGTIFAGSFAAKVDFPTGTNPYSVVIGDFNKDRHPDMVVTNGSDNTIKAFRNTSISGSITAGSFMEVATFSSGNRPVDAIIGDIDGDNNPDLVVINALDLTISVFRNASTSGSIPATWFPAKVDFTTFAGTTPSGVSIGDLNGDGKPEITVSNLSNTGASIFRNTSTPGFITSGTFAPRVDFPTDANSSNIALCDLDGDTKPEMVITNSGVNTVSVLRNMMTEPVPPVISSFTPIYGPVGITVTITGSNFSTTPANNIVWFGAVQATVTTATSSQLTVTVPAGATYQPISVTVNGLTDYSGTPFIVTFPGTHVIDANSFTAKVDLQTGSTPQGVAIGDIDGDGKPDLFVTNINGNSISAYRNIGTSGSISAGSFEPRLDFITGMNPNCITIGDLDGDGKQDLVVTNGSESSISIYRNTSTSGSFSAGSFDARVNLPAGNNPHDIAIGDIDGDGKPDLVVSNFNSSTVTIYRNISIPGSITTGSFAPGINFPAELYLQDIVLADIDSDGKPDLVAPNFYSSTVSVYRNISILGSITSSSFEAKVDFATVLNPISIAIGDLDGDGKPEMIVSGNSPINVSVFHNISTPGSLTSGSFDPKIDFSSGGSAYVAIGDINGDGKPDLVFKNGGSSVSVFKNTCTTGSIGTDSFASGIEFPSSGGTGEIIAGDLDCDGKPDLVYVEGAGNLVSILRNRISEPIPPTIASFNPVRGIVGTVVTINGSNFSTTIADNTVFFGTVLATVTAATATQLTVTVPAGATTQLISVTVNGLTAYTGTSFIVDYPPVITSFSPASGPVGTTVTIEGANFSTVPADNIVLFGTAYASVNSATITQLTVIVPTGATTQQITVIVDGLTTTSSTSFTVTAPPSDPPVILSFNPTSGAVGTTVNISGSNFSTNISNNIVKFGTVQASVISATSTQLAVIVPAGATSQPIYVTVNELTAYTSTSFIVTYAPVITSFNPTSGPVGTTVTIEGTSFGTTPADNTVLFGAVQASVISVTATQLTVIVPAGAITQPITVTANGLSTISGTSFTVTAPPPDPPVISSFNPTSGLVGTTVTIDGTNFSTNISNNIVKFGTVQAVVTAATTTQLTVTVPAGATSQPIYVTINAITAYTSTSFIVTSPPVITSFNPTSGPVGTTVTIEGTNFGSIPADNIVMIGTIQATVTAATATQLTVIVPGGAISQPISVTVNGLTASSVTSFTVTTPPAIMFFNPTSGPVGTTVTITGSNFSTNISNNIVRFGTVQAAVISASVTQLSVIVPAGAASGPINLTADGLTTNSIMSFNVTSAPAIASFAPNSGPVGTTVTIQGANFSTTPADNIVLFGTVQASVAVATATQLTITVPSGATTQTICVTVNGLTACSSALFTVTSSAQQPVISSFNPTSGPVGCTVIITGSNFSPNGGDNIVRFGNLQADLYAATSTQLTVTVPNGATTNPISVTVNGLTGQSSMPFNVTTDQLPIIAGINPTSGPVGSTVTINGANFSQNPQNNIVMFGDAQATITGGNQNQITVLVPEGGNGQFISVTVNGLTAYSAGTFTITIPQDIELESSILTLNGDGINERLVFRNFGAFGKSSFYVYNSRGAVVFWNKDFGGEWDLTVNGRMLETGGYFYVIETELGTFRGSFSILRR